MKIFFRLVKLCVLLAILALVFHNFTARLLCTAGLRYYLGTPVEIDEARVDFLNTQIIFSGVRIKNPGGFPRGILAEISKISVDFEISSVFERRLYFDEIAVHFKELRALRIPGGRLNLLALRAFENQKKAGIEEALRRRAPSHPAFNRLVLTLRRATFTDLSGPVPHQKSFDLKVDQAVYRQVPSLKEVLEIIAWESVKRMGIK